MRILSLDTEYEWGNPAWVPIRSFSFSWKAGKARHVEWTHTARVMLQGMLDSADIVVMHNQAADSLILQQHGIRIPYAKVHDTMVMAWVLRRWEAIGLKPLAYEVLNRHMTELVEIAGSGKKRIPVRDIPQEDIYPYACADADNTRRLFDIFWPLLQANPALLFVYEEIERPLFPVVVDMQATGVCVDWAELTRVDFELEGTQRLLESSLRAIRGRPISLGSNPQLHSYIYDELGYEVQTDPKTGQPTLGAKAIGALRELNDHPFLELLLEWKQVTKLRNSYTKADSKLRTELVGPDGRLHPTFRQAATISGRFASSSPNIQQIPNRSLWGKRIRKCFVAPKGYDWLGADFSQIELRVLAVLTQDEAMIEAFCSGVKFHDWVAEFCGIPKVAAKTINFGKIFGQSKRASYMEVRYQVLNPGDGKEPGVPPTEAQFNEFYQVHTDRLSGMAEHEQNVRDSIAYYGGVRTFFGRWIPCTAQRGHLFRSGLNAPIQGTAADLAKICMPLVWRAVKAAGGSLILCCHDEFGSYTPAPRSVGVGATVKQLMESQVAWRVPVEVEVKIAGNWQDAH